jgi:hypothetical protein
MKPIILTVGILGAGVVGALAGQVLFPAEAPPPAAHTGLAKLEARLDEVSREVERLGDAVRILRDAAAIPNALPPAEALPPGDVDDAGEAGALIPDSVLEEKVRETVEKIAADAREERARKAEASVRQKEKAWLDGIRERLDLTDYQVEEMGKLLLRRRRAIAAIKAKWAERGASITDAEKATLMKAGETLGQRLDEELQKLLSTSQYESLQEMKAERRKK